MASPSPSPSPPEAESTDPPPPLFRSPPSPPKPLISWNIYNYSEEASTASATAAPVPLPPITCGEMFEMPQSSSVPVCPLCRAQRRRLRFCCAPCVNSGRFAHSDIRKPDDLADKELKMKRMERELQRLREAVEVKSERVRRASELRERISASKKSVDWMKPLVKDKRTKLGKMRKLSRSLTPQNELRIARLPQYERKVEQISKCSLQFVRDLANEENRLIARERELAALRRMRASDFSTRVFTIEEVLEPRRDDKRQASGGPETDAHAETDPVAESLADAMHTSFIGGRWVEATSAGPGEGREGEEAFETHYRIVASLLPGVGNYGALYRCVKKDADNLNQDAGNLACAIAAGLLYATQLVQHLALVLDVHLPRRIDFTDFSAPQFSEYGLANRAARLGLNVIYLCLKEGVRPGELKANCIMYNLKSLLEVAGGGGSGCGGGGGRVVRRPSVFSAPTTDFLYAVSAELKRGLSGIGKTPEDLQEEEAEEEQVYGRRAALANIVEGEWEDLAGGGDVEAEMMMYAAAAPAAHVQAHLPPTPRTPSPSSVASGMYSGVNSLASAGSTIVSSIIWGWGGGTTGGGSPSNT